MDREPARLDFALIGHMENWEFASELVHGLREQERGRLPRAEIQELFPWIPPRTVVRLRFGSRASDRVVRGSYIETFISPDELGQRAFRRNLERVRLAAEVATRGGARIVGLGGFTSIVCRGEAGLLTNQTSTMFTTGNTLTAAYIVKGVERALKDRRKKLADCAVLVFGSTGDVGSGCVDYLAGKAKELILMARNRARLERQLRELRSAGANPIIGDDINDVLPRVDAIICAASLSEPLLSVKECRDDVLICDAGYPRNVIFQSSEGPPGRVFLGGRGIALGGMEVEPDLRGTVGLYPLPNVVHGCMLEAVLLALEERWEPFSHGRGAISRARIEEIWSLAKKHGFALAPFFDQSGLWGGERV